MSTEEGSFSPPDLASVEGVLVGKPSYPFGHDRECGLCGFGFVTLYTWTRSAAMKIAVPQIEIQRTSNNLRGEPCAARQM